MMSKTRTLMDDFFPRRPPSLPVERIMYLIPEGRVGDLMAGRARIANLPEGQFLVENMLFRERYADYLKVGLLIIKPSAGRDGSDADG